MQTEGRFNAVDDSKSPLQCSLPLKLYQAVILSVRLSAGINAAPITDCREI